MWRVVSRSFCLTGLCVLAATLGCQRDEPASQPSASAPATAAVSQPASQPLTEPLDLVPAETLLCWYGRAFPDTQPLAPGETSPIWTLLQLGPRLAGTALDAKTKLYARAIEGIALLVRYPHTLALIDAQAKPVESDRRAQRLDQLRFAAIVQAGDQAEAFVRVIQAAINEQTDSGKASLVRMKSQGWAYQELRDARLPDWCVIAWGQIGEFFVFTIGEDVWPTIAAVAAGKSAALSHSQWLADVRGERGRKALIEIILAAKAMRERLDPFVEGRATAFFHAWHAENMERAHWAIGYEGLALYCVGHFVEDGHARETVYADPNVRDPRLLATIPENARYAIYRLEPTRVLPRLCASLLATQSDETRKFVDDTWAQIQTQYGFNAERDVLAHLGDYIVMHNDPPHPLHIPLAMTTLTEIRDQPELVRNTLMTMCRAWQDTFNRLAEERGMPYTANLVNDPDGFWYVQYGPIAGPAWVITDRFIITSWSPAALRSYLEKVGDRVGQREK